MLSNLSRIPPCPGKRLEKSFKLFNLLICEKYTSPKKNIEATKIDKNKLKSNINNIIDVKTKEITVPDHVLLGLMWGIILGPFNKLPNI